jgi:Uncharacterised conserved protein
MSLRKGATSRNKTPPTTPTRYGPSPVPELETLLSRIQQRLDKARQAVQPKAVVPTGVGNGAGAGADAKNTTSSPRSGGGLFSRFRTTKKGDDAVAATATAHPSSAPSSLGAPTSSAGEAASAPAPTAAQSSSSSSLSQPQRRSSNSKPTIRIQRRSAASSSWAHVSSGEQEGALVEYYSEARYIAVQQQTGSSSVDEFVEDLRRVAELVVQGENYITSQEKKRQRDLEREKKRWHSDRDSFDGMDDDDDDDDDDSVNMSDDDKNHSKRNAAASKREQQSPEYANLFDLFFEQNGLGMIVDMLTGVAFESEQQMMHTPTSNEQDADGGGGEGGRHQQNQQEPPSILYLPPLEIATQALQSISILIQNVSRATSLYIILSNDRMNTLIRLPISMYEAAERQRREDVGGGGDEQSSAARHVFASPELAEFTTHFVTLLKSLAMRMNAETLQFFLKYPVETTGGGGVSSAHLSSREVFVSKSKNTDIGEGNDKNDDDDIPMKTASTKVAVVEDQHAHTQVEFPLYERALEFCAAHQDSFVRITAMNICLNTLRLTTVSPPDDDNKNVDNDECSIERDEIYRSLSMGSSPDGVLHNAQPLPFRERLAIAQHTCTPSRVERLIAPIFTKLSERWSSLDEAIREIDSNKEMLQPVLATAGAAASSGIDKVARAKEKVRRERLVRVFKDKAANLQDELLLLEDVFKVGLTVLNEQLIEMMLATFVYPMLLQPLVIFHKCLTSAVDPTRSAYTDHPFGGFGAIYGQAEEELLAPVAGPAKASLFTLAAVFQFISNPPLLRLLYTALFHPLSPDSSSVPTVRSTLEVAAVDRRGCETIRVDQNVHHEGPIPDERVTYAFGTTCYSRRSPKATIPDLNALEDKEVCVFVLSPALAEVLEFRGGDSFDLMTRTRPNSYRKSFLQCLNVPQEMSEVRALAVCTVDAALSAFESKFAADIIFGTELRKFDDDMPLDERNMASEDAHRQDDRGLGDSGPYQSRLSIGREKGGPVGSDPTGEVISALCGATLFATRSSVGDWTLAFDGFASHALLSAARGNGRALVSAAKHLETLWRQASTFLSEQPKLIWSESLGGVGSTVDIPGSPRINAADYDEQMHGIIMNKIFFDADGDGGISDPEHILKLCATATQVEQEGYSTTISDLFSFDRMCDRAGELLLESLSEASSDANDGISDLHRSRESAAAFLKADALVSLLKDLASTGGVALRNINLAGVALSATGSFVQTMDWQLSKKVWAPMSSPLSTVLFESSHVGNMPEGGSIVHLAGSPAIPCVCEAPASLTHLFYGDTTGVVAEGVTWQSLYLVFRDAYLLFAQPIPGGAGSDGRVIAACLLERLEVSRDDISSAEAGSSPARRLLLTYKWFDMGSPPLFLFDELPKQTEVGPFLRIEYFASRLDVWFENQRAAGYAFGTISSHVFAAKSQRGRRVKDILAPRAVIVTNNRSFRAGDEFQSDSHVDI